MLDQKKRAYQFETSSLLALKLVLTEAEKESPPRVLREQRDVNKELALQLIARMKQNHKRFVFKPLFAQTECQKNKSIKKEIVLEP
jgi:hypothetical protein